MCAGWGFLIYPRIVQRHFELEWLKLAPNVSPRLSRLPKQCASSPLSCLVSETNQCAEEGGGVNFEKIIHFRFGVCHLPESPFHTSHISRIEIGTTRLHIAIVRLAEQCDGSRSAGGLWAVNGWGDVGRSPEEYVLHD